MRIVRKVLEVRKFCSRLGVNRKVGFVPTMGDLHEGHLSLIRRSKRENDVTVVSIFVNPSQFNDRKDFLVYRRNEKRDLLLLKKEKVNVTFLPKPEEIYSKEFNTWIEVEELSKNLCGIYRPGHFKGVTTVVAKLLNIVQPHRAYFGMKDYQQLKIIQRMVSDLNTPVEIVPCPTLREKDGLAMSSRNQRLTQAERAQASRIYQSLTQMKFALWSPKKVKLQSLKNTFIKSLKGNRVEYIEVVDPETLKPTKRPPYVVATAVWVGKTRLIDNVLVK